MRFAALGLLQFEPDEFLAVERALEVRTGLVKNSV
jgi:hypothetical protein